MTAPVTWSERASTRIAAYMRTRWAWDTFADRTEVDTWGNLETPVEVAGGTQTYTNTGGAAASYYVRDGFGVHLLLTNTPRISYIAGSRRDGGVTARFRVDQIPTGAAFRVMPALRVVDEDDLYICDVVFELDGSVTIRLQRAIAGSFTILDSYTSTALTLSTTTTYGITGEFVGDTIRARVWDADASPEPVIWQVQKDGENDPTYPQAGGTGVRSAKSAGNTNTNPTVSYSYVAAYEPVEWVDITERVGRPVIGATGRQTELDRVEPSGLSFPVMDFDNWFTPDSTVSPYWPDWQTGCPIRYSDTIGARQFWHPDMWLEIPDVVLSFDDGAETDRMVAVNCVDLLARLQRAPKFVSNMGEYIKYQALADDTLRAYWPLTDPSGSTYANSAGPLTQDPLRYEPIGGAAAAPVTFTESIMRFGSAEGPFGEDASVLEFQDPVGYLSAAGADPYSNGVLTTRSLVAPLTDTDLLTLMTWYWPVSPYNNYFLYCSAVTSGLLTIGMTIDVAAWRVDIATSLGTVALLGPAVAWDQWHLVGVQIDVASGDCALWVDAAGEATGNVDTSAADSPTDVTVYGGLLGTRQAHVQLHMGVDGTYTHDDFLAQYAVGMNGFPAQTVDQRIREIANYAGIIDGRLDLEESDSLIQPPAYAGQSPGDLAQSAAVTGGGVLFTRGSELVYQDRKHRFNL